MFVYCKIKCFLFCKEYQNALGCDFERFLFYFFVRKRLRILVYPNQGNFCKQKVKI